MSATYTSQLCSVISRLTQRSCLSCRSWKWQYAHARVRVCMYVCVCVREREREWTTACVLQYCGMAAHGISSGSTHVQHPTPPRFQTSMRLPWEFDVAVSKRRAETCKYSGPRPPILPLGCSYRQLAELFIIAPSLLSLPLLQHDAVQRADKRLQGPSRLAGDQNN